MTQISATKTRSSFGYTLIELVVVILLIGIVTFATLPRLAALLEPGDLKKAAREIMGAILTARTKAVTEGKIYFLFIDMTNQMYWLLDMPEAEPGGTDSIKETDIVLGEAIKKHNLPGKVKFLGVEVRQKKVQDSGVQIIRCFPMGFTDPAVIYIGTSQSNTYTLTLDGLTGKVEVEERYVQ